MERKNLQNKKLEPQYIQAVQAMSDILQLDESICDTWMRKAIQQVIRIF